MSKGAAWVTVAIASIVAGGLLLPIAAIAGASAWAISIIAIPSIVGVIVWKRSPVLHDRGALLVPFAILTSLLGVGVGFLFFCNAAAGLMLCAK